VEEAAKISQVVERRFSYAENARGVESGSRWRSYSQTETSTRGEHNPRNMMAKNHFRLYHRCNPRLERNPWAYSTSDSEFFEPFRWNNSYPSHIMTVLLKVGRLLNREIVSYFRKKIDV
jgi:hypothetical protein